MNIFTLFGLIGRVRTLEKKMSDLQAKINAEAAEVETIKTGFDSFKGSVSSQIAGLQAQVASAQSGGTLDFSALDAGLAALKSDVDSASLAPAPNTDGTSTPVSDGTAPASA